MKQAKLRKIANALPATTEQIQWGDDRVFKISGKMFACSGIERDSRYSFKVDDERFLELTDQPGICPAPYLARAKWIQIDPAECVLSDNEIEKLIKRSYELVVSKLSKKVQREIARS